jgi:hypothetical protein
LVSVAKNGPLFGAREFEGNSGQVKEAEELSF